MDIKNLWRITGIILIQIGLLYLPIYMILSAINGEFLKNAVVAVSTSCFFLVFGGILLEISKRLSDEPQIKIRDAVRGFK